jgi:hypothetical protein
VLRAITTIQSFLVARRRRPDRDRGQATAEYALVLLGAATIALLLLAWATKSGRVGKLFESVFDAITDKL